MKQLVRLGNKAADVSAEYLKNQITTYGKKFIRLNEQFHKLLIESIQSPMIKRSLERVMTLPFATPSAFAKSLLSEMPSLRKILVVANEQHHAIVEAIQNREGMRAFSWRTWSTSRPI